MEFGEWALRQGMDTSNKGMEYTFCASIWYSQWYFASLPKKISEEIRRAHKGDEEGWGRLKAMVRIGNSEWKTAIWFDKKHETYLLPVKAEIRKKENLAVDQVIEIKIWV